MKVKDCDYCKYLYDNQVDVDRWDGGCAKESSAFPFACICKMYRRDPCIKDVDVPDVRIAGDERRRRKR